MAVDAIYTIAVVIPDVLIPFKVDLVEALNELWFDKYKQVWESCLEAYQTVKSLGGIDIEPKIPLKSPSRGSTWEQISKHKEQFIRQHTLPTEI